MSRKSMSTLLASTLVVSLLAVHPLRAQPKEQVSAPDWNKRHAANPLLLNWSQGIQIKGKFFPYRLKSSSTGIEGVNGTTTLLQPPLSLEFHRGSGRRYTEARLWRTVGAISGGVAGFYAYAPHAISDSRINVSNSQRITEWSLVTVGAAYLGYVIGKAMDH